MTVLAPLPFPVTPRRPGDAEPDVVRLLTAHRALREGCRVLAGAAAAVAAGSSCPPARQQALVRFGSAVLREVRRHGAHEDGVLLPVVAASAGPRADLEPLVDDHADLGRLVDRAEAALRDLERDGPAVAGSLAAAAGDLAGLLDGHVEEEERELLPLVRRHVSAGDLARCEARSARGAGLRHAAFVLAWSADACRTSPELAALLAAPPAVLAPLRRLLLRALRPAWARRRDLVAGG